MREIFENALTSWDKYWDGSFYPYLLLGAALYLLLFDEKEEKSGLSAGISGNYAVSVFLPADFRSDPEMYRQYGLLEGYLASSGSSGHGMLL